MAMKVKDAGGVLRTIKTMRVKDGSALRRILRMKVMDGATLRTVATFATPLSPSISSTRSTTLQLVDPETREPVEWDIAYSATVSPGGGLGPYTYSWAIVSGTGWTISAPTSASTSITGYVTQFTSSTAGTARVTVTDSAGQTATADLTLTTEY